MSPNMNARSRARIWVALSEFYSLSLISSVVLFFAPFFEEKGRLVAILLVWIALVIAAICVRTAESDYSRIAACLIILGGAIGIVAVCAFILPQGNIVMFSPCCLMLIGLLSFLLPVGISAVAHRSLSEVARGQSRFPIIFMVGVGILCCGLYAALTCWRYHEGESVWLMLVLMLLIIVCIFGLAWLYTSRVISSNTSFFNRVFLSNKSKWEIQNSCRDTPRNFFLRALVDSSQYIPRIREKIQPAHGSYHLRTEYDFNIPLKYIMDSKDNIVVIPVLWQHKKELSQELEFEESSGFHVRRMNDSETLKYLKCCLRKWFMHDCKMSLADSKELSEKISTVMWNDSTCQDRSEIDNCIKNKSYGGFISELLRQSNHVKPICVCVEKDAIRSGRISIVSLRDVPLAPVVRLRENGRLSFKRRARRFFTKHRMRYYFNLGNADRCINYHLTFTGPSGTYLSDSNLKCVDKGTDFCIAETMRMNHRYDQENARLYIKNGCGFSRFALMLVYEERSHRSLQALCAASTVSLVLFAYLGLRFVFGLGQNQVDVGDITLPLTALTLTSLLSLWEAMERQRAEEWLWILASSVFVISLIMVLWLTVESAPRQAVDGNPEAFIPSIALMLAWMFSVGSIFSITLSSFVALFMQIRQHGAFMDRVPYTRCAREDCFERNDSFNPVLSDVLSENEIFNFGLNANLTDTNTTSVVIPAKTKYCGLGVFIPVIGSDWGDGWLVPVWSAYSNPYAAGSARYFYRAIEHYGLSIRK